MGAPPQSQMPSVRDMPMVAPRPACYSDSVLEQAKAARLTPDATPCGCAECVAERDSYVQRTPACALVECGICLELPTSGPIVQCPEGHIFCGHCLRRHTMSGLASSHCCPVCRSKLPSTSAAENAASRCRLAELLLADVPASCKHCHAKLTRATLRDHAPCAKELVCCAGGCGWVSERGSLEPHESGCRALRSHRRAEKRKLEEAEAAAAKRAREGVIETITLSVTYRGEATGPSTHEIFFRLKPTTDLNRLFRIYEERTNLRGLSFYKGNTVLDGARTPASYSIADYDALEARHDLPQQISD